MPKEGFVICKRIAVPVLNRLFPSSSQGLWRQPLGGGNSPAADRVQENVREEQPISMTPLKNPAKRFEIAG